MGKGNVRAAIASEGYLSDVEVRLHNMDSQNERSQMPATAKRMRAQQINNMANRFLGIWGLWLIYSVVRHLNFASAPLNCIPSLYGISGCC